MKGKPMKNYIIIILNLLCFIPTQISSSHTRDISIIEIPCEYIFDPTTLVGEAAIRYVFENSEFKNQTEFIVAQCKFESYNFRSNLYMRDRNFVGMGIAYSRNQIRIGINKNGEHGRPTAIYQSDYDCAIDLLDWYRYHGEYFLDACNPTQFVTKLKEKRYFGVRTSHYLNGVNRWMQDKEAKAEWLDEIS
jgi:hypothetical protein